MLRLLRSVFLRQVGTLRNRVRLSCEQLEDRTQPSTCSLVASDLPLAPPDCDVPAQLCEAPPDTAYATLALDAPSPVLLLGGFDRATPDSWPINASFVYVNGGSRFLAIRFDAPIDPATIMSGVNLQVGMREDSWWDPWTEVPVDFEYDADTMTLTLLRTIDGAGNRPPFPGNFYRVFLGGDSSALSPIRGVGFGEIPGHPLGFDGDHPFGRSFEISFMLDDGIYDGKFDTPAGPAPTPHFILIDIAPTPIPIPLGLADNNGGSPAPPTADSLNTTPAPSVAGAGTVRLILNDVDTRALLSAVNSPVPSGFSFRFTSPLSAAPIGGDRSAAGIVSNGRNVERIDLGFLTADTRPQQGAGLAVPPIFLNDFILTIYLWLESVVVAQPTLSDADDGEPAGLVSTASRPAANSAAIVACLALCLLPAAPQRKRTRDLRRSHVDPTTETRA